jgi:hypothetical protein
MRRRSLLAVVSGATATVAGCSTLTAPFRSETATTHQTDDEGALEHPNDDPVAAETLGEAADVDPHVVTVGVVEENRSLEIRVLAGEYEDSVHVERYALADGEHVRFELREPDDYVIEFYEDDDLVGEPYEIEVDWFEYNCPASVIELGAGGRFSASTDPDTDACA